MYACVQIASHSAETAVPACAKLGGMKFHRETAAGVNLIRAWEPGRLRVNRQLVESSVVIAADTLITGWKPQRVEDITLETLQPALDLEPEVVVIGTGARQRFPAMKLLAALQQRGIGVEVMDTAAAARTYNVLVGEERRVVAALLMIDNG